MIDHPAEAATRENGNLVERLREDLAQNFEAIGLPEYGRYARSGGNLPSFDAKLGQLETDKRLFAAINVTLNKAAALSRAPQPDTVTLTREFAAEAWDKYWRDPRGDADALFDALTAALAARGKA